MSYFEIGLRGPLTAQDWSFEFHDFLSLVIFMAFSYINIYIYDALTTNQHC